MGLGSGRSESTLLFDKEGGLKSTRNVHNLQLRLIQVQLTGINTVTGTGSGTVTGAGTGPPSVSSSVGWSVGSSLRANVLKGLRPLEAELELKLKPCPPRPRPEGSARLV